MLRYRGLVTEGSNANVYPQDPVVYPADSHIGGSFSFVAWLRFSLWNAWDDERTPQTELPTWIYDDSQFAGASPHGTIACLASSTPGINTTDLSINTKTWAQNIDIVSRKIDPNVLFADTGVSLDNNPANGAMVLLDQGSSSGLGFNTGLPVVAVPFTVQTSGESPTLQNFSIDVTITIRHSAIR